MRLHLDIRWQLVSEAAAQTASSNPPPLGWAYPRALDELWVARIATRFTGDKGSS